MGMRAAFLGDGFSGSAVPAANGFPQRFGGYLTERNIVRPHHVKRAIFAVIGDGQHLETGPAQQKFHVVACATPKFFPNQNNVSSHMLCSACEIGIRGLTNDHHIGRRLHHVIQDVEQQRWHSGKQDTNPLQRIPFPCRGS